MAKVLKDVRGKRGRGKWSDYVSGALSGGLASVAGTTLVVDHSSLEKIIGAAILLGYQGSAWLAAHQSLVNNTSVERVEPEYRKETKAIFAELENGKEKLDTK